MGTESCNLGILLDEERKMILSGSWDDLQSLAAKKEACLAVLANGAAADLPKLAVGLARNQALLLAAIEGVREVSRRRAAMASSRTGLVTYNAQGTRAEVPVAAPRVERKA